MEALAFLRIVPTSLTVDHGVTSESNGVGEFAWRRFSDTCDVNVGGKMCIKKPPVCSTPLPHTVQYNTLDYGHDFC